MAWKKRPALIMRYYPLDWLSGTEDLSGMVITVEVNSSFIFYEGDYWSGKRKFSLGNGSSGDIIMLFFKFKQLSKFVSFNINYLLGDAEKQAFQFSSNLLRIKLKLNRENGSTFVAFNGVFATAAEYSDWSASEKRCWCILML